MSDILLCAQGLQSGWLFDPDNLSTFVSSPAMAHALDVYQRLLPFLWPDGFCTTNNKRFDAGQCAMNIKWAEGFTVGINSSCIHYKAIFFSYILVKR